jgi:hypothetical protein
MLIELSVPNKLELRFQCNFQQDYPQIELTKRNTIKIMFIDDWITVSGW